MRGGYCKDDCAACCSFLVLQVNPAYAENEDLKRWVELHGIRLQKRGGALWAHIPLPCNALDGTKCGIYETRPNICREWPASQGDIDELYSWTGEPVCTYTFSAVKPAAKKKATKSISQEV